MRVKRLLIVKNYKYVCMPEVGGISGNSSFLILLCLP